MRRPPPGLRPRMPRSIRGFHLALYSPLQRFREEQEAVSMLPTVHAIGSLNGLALYRVTLLSTDRAAIHGLHPQDGACCWGYQFRTSKYAFSSP